jgi:hypothetical protein
MWPLLQAKALIRSGLLGFDDEHFAFHHATTSGISMGRHRCPLHFQILLLP